MLQTIQEACFGEPWALPARCHVLEKPDGRFYRQLVNLYYRLGYDFVPVWPFWVNNPAESPAGYGHGQQVTGHPRVAGQVQGLDQVPCGL